MKQREIQIAGTINSAGEILLHKDELKEFAKQHPNERFVLHVQILPKQTSQSLRGYYYSYVVPTFRQAIWKAGERLTEKQTEERLRRLSPLMWEQKADFNTGRYNSRLRHLSELSNAELIEHIATLQQIGAEEYSIYITDPNEYTEDLH